MQGYCLNLAKTLIEGTDLMPNIFHSTAGLLTSYLQSVGAGQIQLPDFQRSWVWDNERIRRLLVSILQSYPIGAIMLLQSGNPNVKFMPRLVEGVDPDGAETVDIDHLILDGQQRLTSLYQALCTGRPAATRDGRGRKASYWYYLDIEKCVDPESDKDEAVLSVPEDRMIRGAGGQILADYSSIEKECEAGMLPVYLLFDPPGLLNWQTHYFKDPTKIARRSVIWGKLMTDTFSAFNSYQLPIIILLNSTPKEAVCQVFENVNTGGVTLTVFELLTATFAADNYSLRQDWLSRSEGEKNDAGVEPDEYFEKNPILNNLSNTDFLQALTLLVTYERKKLNPNAAVSCKRKDILRLELEDYKLWADRVTAGFYAAAKFLMEQNVFSGRDLPYATQLVPLSAIFVELGNLTHNISVRRKLARWFWCGVFGELYGSAIETRFAKDLPQVVEWIKGGPLPDTIAEATFDPNRLLTLRTRNSAAYKGVHVLLMKEGCRDFLSGTQVDITVYNNDSIDIHHIFPVDYCKRMGIDPAIYNSIVNKTPLSSRTNRIIGGSAPSAYLKYLEENHNISKADLDECIKSHIIDVGTLRADDFQAFFDQRKESLIAKIDQAMN